MISIPPGSTYRLNTEWDVMQLFNIKNYNSREPCISLKHSPAILCLRVGMRVGVTEGYHCLGPQDASL